MIPTIELESSIFCLLDVGNQTLTPFNIHVSGIYQEQGSTSLLDECQQILCKADVLLGSFFQRNARILFRSFNERKLAEKMLPGQMLPGQMLLGQLEFVLDVPRNLPLRFHENRTSNS